MRRFMMKITKKTITTSIVVLCLTSLVQASITDVYGASIQNRKSIFTHTGQDPVYKSFDGGAFPIIPYINKKAAWNNDLIEMTSSFANTLIDMNDWKPSDISLIDSEAITFINDKTDEYSSPQWITKVGSSVPAPPALLLFVIGIFAPTRRKP
jgi:hypothetical protein